MNHISPLAPPAPRPKYIKTGFGLYNWCLSSSTKYVFPDELLFNPCFCVFGWVHYTCYIEKYWFGYPKFGVLELPLSYLKTSNKYLYS